MAPVRTHWLLRHRVLLLVLTGVVTLLWASALPRLAFDFSPQQLFETSETDAEWQLWQDTVARFGRDDGTLFVVLDAGPGGSALGPQARSWLGALGDRFEPEPWVARVDSVADAVTVVGDAGGVDVVPAVDLPAERLQADPLIAGALLSPDGRLAVALVTFADDQARIAQLTAAVDSVRGWIEAHPPPSGLTARLAGIPYVRVDVVRSIHHSQLTFMPLTALVMGLILALVFRQASRVLVPLVTVGIAAVWAVSLMALTGVPVDIINHILPALIAVIGVSDGLHLMIRDQEEHRVGHGRTASLSIAVRALAAACFLTSFTTAVGFASLGTSGTLILRRFGLLVAAGVMMAYLVTLGVLPQALSFFGPPRDTRRRRAWMTSLALGLARAGARRPKLTVAAGLLLSAGLLWLGVTGVHVNIRLTEVYPDDHPLPSLQRLIDAHLGGVLPLDVRVEVPEGEAQLDPEILRRVAALQDRIEAYPGITYARSVVDFLEPLHRALAGPEAGRLPESRALAAQEWLAADLGSAALPLERFVADDGRLLRIAVRTADVGGRHTLGFVETVREMAGEIFAGRPDVRVRVTGDAYLASRNMTQLIRDLFTSLALASGVIFVALLALFRSLRSALVSILPNALPLLAVLGFMAVVGMDLDVTNVVIFSVALGLAVDDSIHVLARFREERRRGGGFDAVLRRTIVGTGQAVVLTTLVLGAGMLVLTTADFVPTRRFGYLTAVTLLVALLADLVLLPALLRLAYARTLERGEAEGPSGERVPPEAPRRAG